MPVFAIHPFTTGMGAVSRYKSGGWSEGICGKLTCNDPNAAELLAIREVMTWAKERDWKDCIILSDGGPG